MFKFYNNNYKKGAVYLAFIALVISLLFTSLAYFTAKVKVTNTFSIGKIALDLEERKFDELSSEDKRLTAGKTIDKDPTMTIKAQSEDTYVFMYVENNINHLTDAIKIDLDAWQLINEDSSNHSNKQVYVYKGIKANDKVVSYHDEDQELEKLFKEIVVRTKTDQKDFDEFDPEINNIIVKGFAHQATMYGTPESNFKIAKSAAVKHFVN